VDWNLATAFESVADALPERPALVQGDQRRTWQAFDDRSARLAAAFAALGLAPGAKVASYLHNSNEYLEGFFAAMKLRAIPVNVNYRYTADELAFLLESSDAELVLFDGTLAERVDAVRDQVPLLKAAVQVDDGSPLLDGALRFEDLIEAHEPAARVERSGGDPFFLYTGGTTGMPKGVVWRSEDIFGALGEAAYPLAGATMPERDTDAGDVAAGVVASGVAPVHLPASPLMHGTGLFTSIQSMFLGGSIVTLEGRSFDPHELWRTVERERVTQMAIVGDAFGKPMLRALDEAAARGEPYDISTLTLMISSGVIWSTEVKRALMAHHPFACFDSLGSSEGVGFATSISTAGDEAATSKFKIGPKARVLDDDGNEVEPGSGQVGMLAVGGFLPSGYYKDPDKSASTFRELGGTRWSIPGDYATVETDGTITLLGRGSVCINSGGEKIYPEEVEAAVMRHPAVHDCVVVGVPDERFGEVVTAVVSLDADTNDSGASLRDDLVPQILASLDELARYKQPRQLVVVDEVPRAPNGKADYKWAKRQATAHLTKT